MSERWDFQLRVYLDDETAASARGAGTADVIKPLAEILTRHDATLVNQFQAFEDYVAEAEKNGVEQYPLYRWTKATIEDPIKRAKHGGTFAVHVGGREVYGRDAADALEADLRPLVGGEIVKRMSRHDTNPANNIQVPAEFQS